MQTIIRNTENLHEIARLKELVNNSVLDLKLKLTAGVELPASTFREADIFQLINFQDDFQVFRVPSHATFLLKCFYNNGAIVEPHFHRFYEFIYLESGRMIDLENGEELLPNPLPYVIKPFQVHRLKAVQESVAYIELLFNPQTGKPVEYKE